MRTTVWITHLSLPALLIMLMRYRPNAIDKIMYLNKSLSVNIILVILNIVNRGKKLNKIDSNPVGGPELNFTEVFGENECTVIRDILHQVVRLRRKITQSVCFDKDTDVPGLYVQPGSKPFLRAFFEIQIAKDINCAVYFAHYIKWLESKSTCETGNNILILTWNDWGMFLEPHLGVLKIKIWSINYEKYAKCLLLTRIIVLYLLMWVLALKQYFVKSLSRDTKQTGPGSVNDNYTLQKDRLLKIVAPNAVSILPHYRNYLPWLWDSNIKRERVIVLVPENRGLSDEEYAFAESSGIDVFKQVGWRFLCY